MNTPSFRGLRLAASFAAILAPGVHAYFGIPYAQPPVGQLRWHAPAAVKPWKGILNRNLA